jgi:hypothetical protein
MIMTTRTWTDYDAVAACEGFGVNTEDELSADDLRSAWQHLIDTGLCWKLQGFFGRTATTLIKSGECHAA